jgi:hypothetical protein
MGNDAGGARTKVTRVRLRVTTMVTTLPRLRKGVKIFLTNSNPLCSRIPPVKPISDVNNFLSSHPFSRHRLILSDVLWEVFESFEKNVDREPEARPEKGRRR